MEQRVPQFQEIADFLKDLNFKKVAWGANEEDVFACIQDIDAMYKDKLVEFAAQYEEQLKRQEAANAEQAQALRTAQRTCEEQQRALQQLQREPAAAPAAPAQAEQGHGEYQAKITEMTGLIATIKKNNEVVEAQAKEQAARLVADATREAAECKAGAEAEARALRTQAQAEAEKTLREARIQAAQLTTEANLAADRAARELRLQLQQEEDAHRLVLQELEQERVTALGRLRVIQGDLAAITETFSTLKSKLTVLEQSGAALANETGAPPFGSSRPRAGSADRYGV